MGWFARRLFGIRLDEALFEGRGFRSSDPVRRRCLEAAGRAFLRGYRAALEQDDPEWLGAALNCVEQELRGFAFEGAGMALTLRDQVTPWPRNRFPKFLRGPGTAHVYMLHVGAGWAAARLPFGPARLLGRLDPLLRWLAIDGYGFHEGYFNWRCSIDLQQVPARLGGYARRAFDQGLGRSLWFKEGADVDRAVAMTRTFALARQADLWSGLGLACAYAGGVDREALRHLLCQAGERAPDLAQGAAFAAKARQHAGNPAAHTDLACEVLCRRSAETVADVTDQALRGLPPDGAEPAYEIWRRRIRLEFREVGRAA